MSAPLLAAIAAETAALQRFVDVLEREQKLLISGDADAVLPLLEEKTGLVAELGTAGQQREAAFRAIGIEIRKDAMEAWVAAAPPELQARWQKLLELAHTANRINSTNGQLINTRLQHNQQALAILMNAAGDLGDNSTYGPDGHQKHGAGSRTLGSA
jgi:flagellar biosynthesis protein FlgN